MEQLDRKVIDLLARPMRIEELRRLLPARGKQGSRLRSAPVESGWKIH